MEEDSATRPPVRLMNFVSEEQLEESKKARGERIEDGTAQRDRPLFEILKENKDKRDAEFSERFKHRPPKALDEDETEFLDTLEMSRKEHERQVADEEAEQLRSFQEALAARASIVHELKETPTASRPEDPKPVGKKSQPARPLSMINITVKPQAKKAKTEATTDDIPKDVTKPQSASQTSDANVAESLTNGAAPGLVSYSDDSEDDN
ncbi:hypothetical protein H6P81_004475 [Aristolochia fimbriata]|uniref:FAM192A/Fyv6 N-terminal domain-containing protein n=1 Tax=Aristolochia fimbriata TaxID=158543 RepID=A0AAV7FFH2_ARIFI|nr:hypothetical protein H6P81_004475 [Aristolochia fimbriata]